MVSSGRHAARGGQVSGNEAESTEERASEYGDAIGVWWWCARGRMVSMWNSSDGEHAVRGAIQREWGVALLVKRFELRLNTRLSSALPCRLLSVRYTTTPIVEAAAVVR
jgi:hypothetical protein